MDKKSNGKEEKIKYQYATIENVNCRFFENPKDGNKEIANEIANRILKKQENSEHIVLAVDYDPSLLGVYEELIHIHLYSKLSFYNVHFFNIKEVFINTSSNDKIGCSQMLNDIFFSKIDVPKDNLYLFDNGIPINKINTYIEQQEKKILQLEGIDLLLASVSKTGRIAFNAQNSTILPNIKLVQIDSKVIQEIYSSTKESVHRNKSFRAISFGISQILEAKELIIVAWGSQKSAIVSRVVEGDVSAILPVTHIQDHSNACLYIDKYASGSLTRYSKPWLAGICNWDKKLVIKAITWLSLKLLKPILKLSQEDYIEYQLSELLVEFDSYYQLNLFAFNNIQHKITGWPGGKPHTDDSLRPVEQKPYKKKILIFSPLPDDAFNQMGGTINRLVEQGHQVFLAILTDGSNTVFDHDALKYLDAFKAFNKSLLDEMPEATLILNELSESLIKNKQYNFDNERVSFLKKIIRQGEVRNSALFAGIQTSQLSFLNLKKDFHKQDFDNSSLQSIRVLLKNIKPNQIYIGADLADPNSIKQKCLELTINALRSLNNEPWMKRCSFWLYRSDWQRWNIEQIDMCVPMNPEELYNKRLLIFFHQTQKDRPPSSNQSNDNDIREYWQRAEAMARNIAMDFRKLGFVEYEAMETFKRIEL